ncbi:hypothetical protein [Pontibacter arcticus]|uniref:Uncharacterized protein n=1 Tax=Pontibacter arcticus TaxID=2080288 RepID=A0A364RFU2_9BACT|nr:hypothetical protein [Pontibacter arcticus]RAU83153.1 hypothetical protein DP923_07960 [Pontibacter arcticus]
MIQLNDPEWKELEGGYRTPYNASIALRRLEETNSSEEVDDILAELWDELHHQGNVGLASYFAVPHLIRIAKDKGMISANMLGLIAVIEVQRHKKNPQIPKEYVESYLDSLNEIPELVDSAKKREWDLEFTIAALSALAASKRQIKIAQAVLNFDDEDVLDEFLETY